MNAAKSQIYKNRLKVYLLIADDVPIGYAINSAFHAGTALKENNPNDETIEDWVKNHFYSVTCKVSREKFEYAKIFDKYEIITESALNNIETVLVFHPRRHNAWEPFFKDLPLYS